MKVAITGGIGSGKTFVASKFEELGIAVYYADKEAKRLMSFDSDLKARIKSLLGKKAYHKNGRLNRAYVAQRIFADKNLLLKINKIVHPAVKLDFESWAEKQSSAYVLEESAIVFENKLHKFFDSIILVIADKNERIKRVMKRDKIPKIAVLARIDKQLSDKKKIPLANFVINNNFDETVGKEVIKVHKQLLGIINTRN